MAFVLTAYHQGLRFPPVLEIDIDHREQQVRRLLFLRLSTNWFRMEPTWGEHQMASEPAHVIRLGLIKCCIFFRNTRSGDRFNVSVTRLFKNGDTWSESHYFGRDDLLLVAKVMDLAHSWVFAQGQSVSVPSTRRETRES